MRKENQHTRRERNNYLIIWLTWNHGNHKAAGDAVARGIHEGVPDRGGSDVKERSRGLGDDDADGVSGGVGDHGRVPVDHSADGGDVGVNREVGRARLDDGWGGVDCSGKGRTEWVC